MIPTTAAQAAVSAPAKATITGNAGATITGKAGTTITGKAGAGLSGPCPSAARVSAAAGVKYGSPTVRAGVGSTLCTYPDAAGFTAISVQKDAEYSPETARGALKAQAKALGSAAVSKVDGLGDAAYEFTFEGQTTLGVVSGTAYLAVVNAPSPAVAKALIALVLH